MSEKILNEIVEETTETTEEIVEIPQRVNPFCVISKEVIPVTDINGKKHDLHMIETNSSWGANPYKDYAVVPDDMVTEIMETRGFCDIELNEDGTEVVSFTALEKPEIKAAAAAPTQLDQIEAQVAYTAMMTGTLLEV